VYTLLTPPKTDEPLTSEHYQELAVARERAKKIRKAAGVAALNGWSIGIFAALSAPFALLSVSGFLVCLALTVVAYNEFRGRKGLLRFDPSAATRLGLNQLCLVGLITLYCLWMIYVGLTTSSPLLDELKAQPDVADALGSLGGFDELYKQLLIALYGGVIVMSAIFQGLNALYYFSRRKYVEAYVEETPAWVIELQRSTAH
jgi:hypothetical protein